MRLCISLICLIIVPAFAFEESKWVQTGTVCALGANEDAARIKLTEMLEMNKKIYLHGGAIVSGRNIESDKYIIRPSDGPYIIGKVEKIKRDGAIGRDMVCAEVTGVDPSRFENRYFDCIRKDKGDYDKIYNGKSVKFKSKKDTDTHPDAQIPNIHVNLESNNNFYITSNREKLKCSRTIYKTKIATLDCPLQGGDGSDDSKADARQFYRLTLDQNSGRMDSDVCNQNPKDKSKLDCTYHSSAICKEVKKGGSSSSPAAESATQ